MTDNLRYAGRWARERAPTAGEAFDVA